jgi:hypothetical protein
MQYRRRRIILLAFLSPIVLLLIFPLVEHVRGRIALKRIKHHLVAKGVKLSAQDLKSFGSQGENATPEFFQATAQLRRGSVVPNNLPPSMRLMPSGRAIVGFHEEEWIEDKKTNNWTQLLADLEENEPTLEKIRLTLQKPRFDNQLDYSQGANMKFSQLVPAKTTAQWLGAETQLALHEAHNKKALESLVAESQLTRVLAEDRILISELVRMAIAAIARTGVWEALQADGWDDAELAKLSETWQSITFASNMIRSLEGELVFGIAGYDSMRTSNSNAAQVIFGMQSFLQDDSALPWWERTLRTIPIGPPVADFIKEQIYCRLWRFAWLDQDELHYLQFMEALFEIAHRAESEKSLAAIQPDLDLLVTRFTRISLYNNLRYPQDNSFGTLAICFKRSMKAETERSLILSAIALKRYALRFGKSPPTLDILIPEFFASVPADYMDGRPIKYRFNDDRMLVLYSVGEDGKDDGGDSGLQAGKTGLRNLWERKDFVWPLPASPDELKAYHQEKASGR